MEKDEEIKREKPNPIVWNAFDTCKKKPSIEKNWIIVMISLTGFIISIIYSNFLFAVIFVLFGVFFIFAINKKPAYCEFRLDDVGMHMDGVKCKREDITGYNIVDDPRNDKKILVLGTQKMLDKIIRIPIRDRQVETIRTYFNFYKIDMEKEINTTLADFLAERI